MPDPCTLSWHPVETVGLLSDGLGQFIVCFDRRETQLNARLVDSHLPLERTISRISDTAQTGKKSPASRAQILLSPVSRQDILRFPEFRTVFW